MKDDFTQKEQIEIIEKITDIYKENANEHKALREARCLEVQIPGTMLTIKKDDVLAGRCFELPAGFSCQVGGQGLGYYCLPQKFESFIKSNELEESAKDKARELAEYWSSISIKNKIEERMDSILETAVPKVNIDFPCSTNEVVMPLYRLAGAQLNYKLLLDCGIEELKINIDKNVFDLNYKKGMVAVLNTLQKVIDKYISEAENLLISGTEHDKRELKIIIKTLKKIRNGKPGCFREALQLMWLYSVCSGVRNYGRMDVYLGDYLIADIDAKIIDRQEAIRIISGLYRLIKDTVHVTDGRFTVGGMGRINEQNADEFAILAMEATRQLHDVLPQITLRFYSGQNPQLMKKAYEVLRQGCTFPLLYNDDVNVPSIANAFSISFDDSIQYLPYSCGEIVIDHASLGTPSCTLNILKALEITIFNGRELKNNRKMGLELGYLTDFNSFQDFFEAFKKQLKYYIQNAAKFEKLEYSVAGEEGAFLFISILTDSCLERSTSILPDGIRHLGGTLECYGNTNTSDSLVAIKKIVYEDNLISKKKLMDMIKGNFEDCEPERKILLKAPKYGNDEEFADEMMVQLHEFICKEINAAGQKVGLDSFNAVIINNSFNTVFGKITAASADGRPAWSPMANANNPSGGMDRRGVTAMLNSLVKLRTDIHAGSVQNMKFSRNLFHNNPDQLDALLRTYFAKGGNQAMISVVNKNDLENALINPQLYPNLLVRVGGFTERFINLQSDVQQEIISRMLYE